MTRVIHTGDTHLGYRQYHLPERREDFRAAFEQVAEDAVADDVDAVVHAGDLFHDRRPGLQDILGALSVLRDLDDAGIPFLAVVGNHETKRNAQWLDLFESLGLATRLDDEPTVIGDTAFYGLDFVPRSRREDLEYDFAPHDTAHAALVSHGLFEPFQYADWDTETVLVESTVDFDAVLLGDNHAPGKERVEGTWVTYCGSTERASADERDERGYNIVQFDGVSESASDSEGSETECRTGVSIIRRGLPTREFVFVDVELGEGEGVERVRERIGQYDLEDAVVVVTIDGDGEPITPATVEEYADEEGALVARVTDHREIADSEELDVSFADPDEAVRDQIRELGLSTAARDLDETIRASKTPDSKVTDEVERRVRDLVEDGDTAAFEPAPEEQAEGGAGTEPSAGEEQPAGDQSAGEQAEADGGGDPPDASDDHGIGSEKDSGATGDEGQPTLGEFE
jgi:DNA repair exonuclease SbcCD nuclease subunit